MCILVPVSIIFMLVGCSFKPILITETVPEPVDKSVVTATAIQVLQTKGYTIALANEKIGTVTTEWADATGFWDLGSNRRKQVMVSVSPDGKSVNVQMTMQLKNTKAGEEWENARIGKKETQQTQEILREILEYISGAASTPSSQPTHENTPAQNP